MTPHVQGVKGTEARFWERGRECIEFPVPGAMPTTLKFPPFNLHMSLSQCCYLHFIDERQERKLLNVEAEPLTQICLIPKENSLSIFNFMLLLEKKNGTPQNNLYLGLLWTALTSSKWGFLKDTWHLGKWLWHPRDQMGHICNWSQCKLSPAPNFSFSLLLVFPDYMEKKVMMTG